MKGYTPETSVVIVNYNYYLKYQLNLFYDFLITKAMYYPGYSVYSFQNFFCLTSLTHREFLF